MQKDDLKNLNKEQVKAQNNQYLIAIWHEQNGEWDEAHRIVQNLDDPMAYRIHAYLHRKEGNIANSQHWYNRAEIPYNDQISFDEEIAQILQTLCQGFAKK